MPLIQVPNNVSLAVEIPDGCERSAKGALYLRPGTKVLTKDEWEHFQKTHPKTARTCHVVQYRPGEDYDVDKSIVGRRQKVEREKTAATAARHPSRAEDKPTKRQRALAEAEAEAEAKTKGDGFKIEPVRPTPTIPVPPSPPVSTGNEDPKSKSKDKAKPK